MSIEESIQQMETLIEAWQLDEADLNQTDINAMQVLLKENQELKKQVEEYQQELEKADSITQSCIFNGKEESKISYRKCLNILDKKETQQKEFIKYLEDEKDRLAGTCDIICDSKFGEADDNLQKYKEIIGVEK